MSPPTNLAEKVDYGKNATRIAELLKLLQGTEHSPGLTWDDLQFPIDNSAALQKIIGLWRSLRLPSFSSHLRPSIALGQNFIGVDEVIAALNLPYTENDLKALQAMPFYTDEELKTMRDTHWLVPILPTDLKFLRKVDRLVSNEIPFYNFAETPIQNPLSTGWLAVRVTASVLSKPCAEERLPTVVETIYLTAVLWRTRGARLGLDRHEFDQSFIQTSTPPYPGAKNKFLLTVGVNGPGCVNDLRMGAHSSSRPLPVGILQPAAR